MRLLLLMAAGLACACVRIGFHTGQGSADGAERDGGGPSAEAQRPLEASSWQEASPDRATAVADLQPLGHEAGAGGETLPEAGSDRAALPHDGYPGGEPVADRAPPDDATSPGGPDASPDAGEVGQDAPLPSGDGAAEATEALPEAPAIAPDGAASSPEASEAAADADASPAPGDAAADGDAAGAPTLRSVCAASTATIVEGTSAGDTLASQTLATSVAAACGNALSIRQVAQDTPGVLDTSGRPLLGPSDLAVIAGGHVTQRAIAYLEISDTPVIFQVNGNHYQAYTRAGAQIFSMPLNKVTSTHDIAIIMVVSEPISQTLVLDVFGINATGTQAGAFYFANTLAPNLTSETKSYYVVEWYDQDGDAAPTSGDQYIIVGSG